MKSTPESEIRTRIAQRGQITFAEFMEIALYHPNSGYYIRGLPPATHGDYFTSPEAHPAFGALIALQLWLMWKALECPRIFSVIEMGAGRGLIARDVMEYSRSALGPFASTLRYVALDRSPAGITIDNAVACLQRVVTDRIPLKGIVGCFLSNELVDAFPVHRFEIQDGTVKEVYITLENERYVEVLDEPSTQLLPRRLETLGLSLPDGYRGEVNLRIGPWVTEVAAALDRGFVLTIDYGYEASDLYSAERSRGTLQTYFRHTTGSSPYHRIGQQDITAHVDFSALVFEGYSTGLRPVLLRSQTEFLSRLGLDRWIRMARKEKLSQRERDANIMAMRQLIRPDGLGRFKVLVQEKNTGITDPDMIDPTGGQGNWTDDLPIPLLRSDNVPLLEGRYPHMTWDLDELWSLGDRQT